MHSHWKDSKSIKTYEKKKLVIELVHNKNKLNDTFRYKPLLLNFDLSGFALDTSSIQLNTKDIILKNLKWFVLNSLRLFMLSPKYIATKIWSFVK